MSIHRKAGRPVGQSADLTKEELQILVNLPDRRTREGMRDHAVLLALTNTPMRKAELCSLTLGNLVDEGPGFKFITYEGLKQRKQRDKDTGEIKIKQRRYWLKVDVIDGVFERIMQYVRIEYRRNRLNAADPLFFTLGKYGPYKKRPITPDAVDLIVKKYVLKAGIKKRVTPHSFRATYVTLRIDGVNPADMLGLTGHKDITGVIPYARRNSERQRAAALKTSCV